MLLHDDGSLEQMQTKQSKKNTTTTNQTKKTQTLYFL